MLCAFGIVLPIGVSSATWLSDNCKWVLDPAWQRWLLRDLNLQFNKSRQQAITNELLDIVGGSSNN